jgi:CheY-like chemotaxis protein
MRVTRQPNPSAGFSKLSFEIIDTGIGIAPEVQKKLFNSFSQADTSTTRKYGGTGLGLAISQRLVNLMGGEISVRSEEARGSCFRFALSLPLGEEARVESLEHSTKTDDSISNRAEEAKLHILVAEDNAINQKVLVHMLKQACHQIDLACDGFEAVEMARQKRYDLILMDCQMPGMDGLDAARTIRSGDGKNSDTPIVAVTANAFSDDRQRCLAAGMNDHVSKPITKVQLDAALERWVLSALAVEPVDALTS